MNNERMIAVSSDLIERAISLLDLLPESGTIIELRAALATQPVVRKYVAPVSIATFEKAITEEALAAGFNEPDLSRHEVDGCEVYVQQHIQAAYSGWKLALEVSPAQQAIDLLVEALVAPNAADLPGRIDSFLDSLPAVRGAEHE
ncbi:hypothetical protein [Pseudomonas sp. GM_Psu_2]|uniref:hypothetical protein n=1 Tax=unclassified Pseudomonas TaxID=196821 RepID=UPI002269C159|nr:hypothetical protein [Pseudomonas sp. GM_Psu_2]